VIDQTLLSHQQPHDEWWDYDLDCLLLQLALKVYEERMTR